MVTASWDDGCASDTRVADLMARYEVPAVFYWPVEWHSLAYDKGYEPLGFAQAQHIARQFEVGSHTITHRHLTSLDPYEAMYEIVASGDMLERLFDREVSRFCPPRGYTNPSLTKFTLGGYKSQRLTKGPGLVHVHPKSGANDNEAWQDKLKQELKKGDVEIWGHSHELDRFDLWAELEEALRGLSR